MFEITSTKPKQPRETADRSHPRSPAHEDAPAPQEDPLGLDPYSPTFPVRAVWNDPDPLSLDPYSPIAPRRR